jgi:hypothetical protein
LVLFLALAIVMPAYGGHGNDGKGRGNEGHGRGNDKHADHGRPEKAEYRKGPDHGRERVVIKQRERVVVRRGPEGRHVPPGQAKKFYWGDHRAREWAHEHQTWKMRGGYRGYMVPRERFVVYFGPRHVFRVHRYPVVIVAGRPRFHYNGFYVTLVDPWPEYWAPDWYEADDVYVDYIDDGYYLFNRRHPGVSIAVNISL